MRDRVCLEVSETPRRGLPRGEEGRPIFRARASRAKKEQALIG